MLVVGIEQLLEFANALAKAGGFLARFFLVHASVVVGTEIAQADFRGDFDRLRHAETITTTRTESRQEKLPERERVWIGIRIKIKVEVKNLSR